MVLLGSATRCEWTALPTIGSLFEGGGEQRTRADIPIRKKARAPVVSGARAQGFTSCLANRHICEDRAEF